MKWFVSSFMVTACAASTGAVIPDAGPDGGTPGDGGCLGSTLLEGLGKQNVLVGAYMSDSTSAATTWDVRYIYLAGGLFDSPAPCTSCATGCTAQNKSCANSANGCAWWGCYQYDQNPPGEYARNFVANAAMSGQVFHFTYYELLQASGVAEGSAEVTQAATNASFMTRYLADFRFLLQQIGTHAAFVQVEPDFWAYAQIVNADPHKIPAAVATANATDCGAQENSIAGMGRCMIAMARKYAPGARIGLHGSGFATGQDVLKNSNASLDVAAEAAKLGAFLLACGAGASDFITVDASDRDAGFNHNYWDATNATLPNFHQAFAWAKALAETVGKPIIWWQVPLGNSSTNYTDNRVDYFFSHTSELAAAHSAGMFFGAGASGQTTPETDGGNLIAKEKAYIKAPQRFCH